MWQAWINGGLGLWLITIAFFPLKNLDCVMNNIFIGLISVVAGWMMKEVRPWQGWASILLGGWLIVTLSIPDLLFGLYHQWNLSLAGVLLTVSGFTALAGVSDPQDDQSQYEL